MQIHWLTSNHIDVEGFGVATKKFTIQKRLKRETVSKVPEEHLVVQTITITDKFGFRGKNKSLKKLAGGKAQTSNSRTDNEEIEVVSVVS